MGVLKYVRLPLYYNMEQDLEYMFINALALATHSEVLLSRIAG